jgi:ATP-dependent Clp protease ATP-binding subunit ClpA
MALDDSFSDRSKEIIKRSREVAIELGYDYISTIHIMIADCESDYAYSIRNFAFKMDSDFNAFYQNHHIGTGNPSLLHESLPLTLEAEKTIRASIQLWHRSYIEDEVQPYHLFLAAANIKNSLFRSSFKQQGELFKKLENYYIDIGAIEEKNIRQSFLQKLFRK